MKSSVVRVLTGMVLAFSLCASAAVAPLPPKSPQEYADRMNAVLAELAVLNRNARKIDTGTIRTAPTKTSRIALACGCGEGPVPHPRGSPRPGPITPFKINSTVLNGSELRHTIEVLSTLHDAAEKGQEVEIVSQGQD
jgi:hypothetical protein